MDIYTIVEVTLGVVTFLVGAPSLTEKYLAYKSIKNENTRRYNEVVSLHQDKFLRLYRSAMNDLNNDGHANLDKLKVFSEIYGVVYTHSGSEEEAWIQYSENEGIVPPRYPTLNRKFLACARELWLLHYPCSDSRLIK